MVAAAISNLKNGSNQHAKKEGGSNEPPTNNDPKDAAEPSAAEGVACVSRVVPSDDQSIAHVTRDAGAAKL